MSKSESEPTLTRSSSANLFPRRRPPTKRTLSDENLGTENLKLSSLNISSINDQTLSQEASPNRTNSDDNDTDSSRSSDEDISYDPECNAGDYENVKSKSKDFENEFANISSNTADVNGLNATEHEKSSQTLRVYRYNFTSDVYQILKFLMMVTGGVLIAITSVCWWAYVLNEAKSITIDLNIIMEKFPMQNEDFWTAFKTGVQDVDTFSRPATFIFLYEKNAENTLENLLEQLSKYATCKIADCSKEPIIVTDTELNSPEIVEDYGKMIDRYQNKLKENAVMLIKDIQNVQGISAQAFHSFCDEYSPLVAKSLFIFTMKVDKLDNQNNMNYVEEYFKNKWTDINIDTLNALITRITSMVLEVKP